MKNWRPEKWLDSIEKQKRISNLKERNKQTDGQTESTTKIIDSYSLGAEINNIRYNTFSGSVGWVIIFIDAFHSRSDRIIFTSCIRLIG